MPRTVVAIDKIHARNVWLQAQRLDESAPFGAGTDATRAAIEHLGYVQIDTINVIERCHHHILFTRIPGYARDDLRRVHSVDKTVFEYWAHALAYLPTRDMPHFVRDMQAHRKRETTVKNEELRKVLSRIRRHGALSLRDIDDDVLYEKTDGWASKKPSARALRLAFYQGHLTISERNGILKTYDLASRHFGWSRAPRAASERETRNYLLDRALRSQGVVSLDSVCYMDAPRKPAMRRLIEGRVRRREMVPVALEGGGKTEFWVRPETLDVATTPAGDLVHILSPFDPLIIQRKRLKFFFDYEHVFEAYVPKPKRRFGYFALPVLVGNEIVATLDLKTDRENRRTPGAAMDLARPAREPHAQEEDRRGATPLRAVSVGEVALFTFSSPARSAGEGDRGAVEGAQPDAGLRMPPPSCRALRDNPPPPRFARGRKIMPPETLPASLSAPR